MLHMAILRSPFAHAKINGDRHLEGVGRARRDRRGHRRADGPAQPGLDAHAVLRHPGRAGHRQGAVPGPGGGGRHRHRPLHRQGRPGADRRRLRTARARRHARSSALEAGRAASSATDKEGQTDNHIYHWEAGDKEATDAAFAEADVVVSLDTFYPRCHPSPLETCGCVADVNPATGQATIYMTSQAPHAIRTVFALVAGLPEEKIRIISPGHRRRVRQQGARLPGLRGGHRGLAAARPPGEVDRGPHREPDLDRVRPRLPHARRAGAEEATGRCSGCAPRSWPTRARSTPTRSHEVQGGAVPHRQRVLRPAGRARGRGRRVHEQGSRRRGVPVLVPRDRGLVPDRAPGARTPRTSSAWTPRRSG